MRETLRAAWLPIAFAVGVLAASTITTPTPKVDAAERRHWATGSRTLRIENRTGDSRWRQAAIHAVENWNAFGADIDLVYTDTPSYSGDCRYYGTTVSICRANLPRGVLGETHYAVDGSSHLVGAFVQVTADTKLSDGQEQSIACHELGHALGLDHSPNTNSSCMTTSPRSFPLGPDKNDASILRSTYAARD